jgi:hypothetical protein
MKTLFSNDIKYLKVSGTPNPIFVPIKTYVDSKQKHFRFMGKFVSHIEIWEALKNIQQEAMTNSEVELELLKDLVD